jgi:hypothetical protein
MMALNRYAYLLVFDSNIGTEKEVSKFLDEREDIFQNWMTVLPNSFFIVSDKSAKEIADVFRSLTQNNGRFIVLDVETDRNGWLPKKAWEFIKNPKPN